MSGIGEAAAVAGVISFAIARTQECLAGIDAISKARNFGKGADILRNRLRLARADLMYWMEQLEQAHANDSSPLRSLDWHLVRDTLAQLESMLSDAKTLEERYNFSVVDDDRSIVGQEVPERAGAENYFARALRRLRPDAKFASAQKLQKNTSAYRMLTWGVTGETKLHKLIIDIEDHVQALTRLVKSKELHFVFQTQRLLAEMLAGASSPSDVQAIESVLRASRTDHHLATMYEPAATLATLKAHRLQLGVDVTAAEMEEHVAPASEKTKMPSQIRLKGGEMQFVETIAADRAAANFRGTYVVLEYKRMSSNQDKLKYRILALGMLLSRAKSDVLATLPFLGLYEDIGSERYAFVFRTPYAGMREPPQHARPLSLLECIRGDEIEKPSFNSRLRISLVLAQAIRNFHTAGWLHKCIRSDNVLVFRGQGGNINWEDSSTGPYLAGFGFARAANPTEFSEIPLTSPNSDIYCHEAVVGPDPKPFRKIFDLYALGILLLEVNLWKGFPEMMDDARKPENQPVPPDPLLLMPFRKQLMQDETSGSIMHSLAQNCPTAVCEAVRLCIRLEPEDQWDNLELSVDKQNTVVEKLMLVDDAGTREPVETPIGS